MKTFQHFSPYNGRQWEANGSRSKRQFQCKRQTVQRVLNDFRRWIRVLSYLHMYAHLVHAQSWFLNVKMNAVYMQVSGCNKALKLSSGSQSFFNHTCHVYVLFLCSPEFKFVCLL